MERLTSDKAKTCGNCKYYTAHYGKWNGRYNNLGMGHCLNKPWTGNFKSTEKICKNFVESGIKERKVEEEKTIKKCLETIDRSMKALVEYVTGQYFDL